MARTAEKDDGIGGFFRRVPEFVNQVKAEAVKIAWPTRKETMMTTVMVVIMTTLLGVFFLAVDKIFDTAAQALLKLVS